jgi:cytochrome o ubiquinol oxidase subunit IV
MKPGPGRRRGHRKLPDRAGAHDAAHHRVVLHCMPDAGQPSIPVALAVLAQMGVHLVFFLHITSGPDNVSNVMALAFAVLIVLLVIAGSLWIMAHLNHNMMPMNQIMQMQR